MDVAEVYERTRGRLLDTATAIDTQTAGAPVPALPGWSVKDAYAHLTGLCCDVLDGRMDGAGSPPWTAKQVQDRAGRDLADVCAEWAERAPALDERLRTAGDQAPAFIAFDVWSHEQDVRGALGGRGERGDDRVAYIASRALPAFDARLRTAGSPAVRVVHSGREALLGDGEPVATLQVDDYELLRILFGRRSAGQLARQDWRGDPGPALEHLHLFDLPTLDLSD